MKEYNTTQLHPDKEFDRHIFHRDQFAHYLRWTHVLKSAKIGMNILDWGCADANLLEVLYRNRYRPNRYLGIDIRNKTIEKAINRFKNLNFAKFICDDLVTTNIVYGSTSWDIITCFEVLEHIQKKNSDKFLLNIKKHMNDNTLLLLSTPCYDAKVGAANNHILNDEVMEFTFDETKQLLQKYFIIEDVFGTFASQRDYKEELKQNKELYVIFERLHKYYDSNVLSVLIAPLFPEKSRNCLWRLRNK